MAAFVRSAFLWKTTSGFLIRYGMKYDIRNGLRRKFKLIGVWSNLYSTQNGDKEHCNVGTIGHVDHGKTTLTAAITKVRQLLRHVHDQS